jgi:hypothetical protein
LAGSENAEIFVFSKRDKDSSTIKPFSGYEATTLELLGVLNTSTLLSNCSVWVEGVTDRLYLRAYLTAYLKSGQPFNPIEGLNYTFIEYGGNNLVHYLFEDNTDPAAIDAGIKAYFINNKIFLLSDKDFDKDEKHQFYKKLATKNFQYMHTQHAEIENLLPPEILAAFLTDKLNVPADIAKEITKYSYKSTRLGKFLTGQFTKHQINRKVAAASGTLTTGYKSMLAEYVLNGVQSGKITWVDFKSNMVIDEITTNLYNFIEKHNRLQPGT